MNENPPRENTSTARAGATASLLVGTPLAIISVMLWQNYHPSPPYPPLTIEQAAAIGSVGAAIMGYFWHAMTVIGDFLLSKLRP